MSHDVEYMVEQINERLAGATIRNAVISDDKQSFGLELVKKAKGRGNYTVFPVWVDCDAEGNGPGWLSIGGSMIFTKTEDGFKLVLDD